MITVNQIILQLSTENNVDRVVIQNGPLDNVQQKILSKEVFSLEEQELWDAFVTMIKSKE